jgi:hypothetical protein
MATLEYKTNIEFNREASAILLEFNDELTIHEFKTICMRMAAAIGYTSSCIKKSFGDAYDGDIESETEELYSIIRNMKSS